jgi:hypothetical protein
MEANILVPKNNKNWKKCIGWLYTTGNKVLAKYSMQMEITKTKIVILTVFGRNLSSMGRFFFFFLLFPSLLFFRTTNKSQLF